jgi:hypothetical protein
MDREFRLDDRDLFDFDAPARLGCDRNRFRLGRGDRFRDEHFFDFRFFVFLAAPAASWCGSLGIFDQRLDGGVHLTVAGTTFTLEAGAQLRNGRVIHGRSLAGCAHAERMEKLKQLLRLEIELSGYFENAHVA